MSKLVRIYVKVAPDPETREVYTGVAGEKYSIGVVIGPAFDAVVGDYTLPSVVHMGVTSPGYVVTDIRSGRQWPGGLQQHHYTEAGPNAPRVEVAKRFIAQCLDEAARNRTGPNKAAAVILSHADFQDELIAAGLLGADEEYPLKPI